MTILWVLIALVLVVVAGLIYPGELSQVSSGSNRWLYDRAASGYEKKWQSEAYVDQVYERAIERHSLQCLDRSGATTVLDLGCGTGRGIRVVSKILPPKTRYVGIDFSPRMLEELRVWLESQTGDLGSRVELLEQNLTEWAQQEDAETFGLVFLLEVGEFVPGFKQVLRRIAEVTAPGGGVILTRPAGLWWLFFPGRGQSRRSLRRLLTEAGFQAPEFLPWRSRYELVFCRKPSP